MNHEENNKVMERYRFELYVMDNTPTSEAALRRLRVLCDQYLREDYELEIVDVSKNQQRVVDNNILAIPTLIKLSPLPVRRLIGDLSDTNKVLSILGLEAIEQM